ncbi:MAG TPA: type II secretion system protein N [Bordetella sp.]
MRSSRIAVSLLAIVVALASAAVVLPARWLLSWVPASGPLAVVDADGTIWHGQAWIAIGYPETRRMLTDPVQWQWRGWTMALRHPWLRGPLVLAPGWDGMRLSAQQVRLPAAALTALGAPFNTMGPGGFLEVSWNALSTHQPQAAGPLLDLLWRDASSAVTPLASLGDFRLRVASTGQALTLDLSTEHGPLDLTGHGAWDGRALRFQGQAKTTGDATAEQAAGLNGLLNLIGPRRGGAHVFGFPTLAAVP